MQPIFDLISRMREEVGKAKLTPPPPPEGKAVAAEESAPAEAAE